MFVAASPEAIAMKGLILAIVSGLSLPVGAVLGIWLSPVNDEICGAILAFGGGALLFAVTVSIYGHALSEFKEGGMARYECWTTIIGGIAGSLFYLYIARWLEEGGPEERHGGDAEKALLKETVPLAKPSRRSTFMPAGSVSRRTTSLGKSSTLCEAALTLAAMEDDEEEAEKKKSMQVAYSLFAGLLIDGVPEGVFMGFLAAEGKLSLALIVSLLIANFPEAFSSSSLLERAGIGYGPIMAMWGGLCLLVGTLCGLSCWSLLHIFPAYATGAGLPKLGAVMVSLIEGFTGGAMLSCIAAVMLPEAQERVGKGGSLLASSGFLTTLGFLTSVGLEVAAPSM